MSDQDFFRGLKEEDDERAEWMAGAEHLVRLRQQAGGEEEEPLQKEAGLIDALKDPATLGLAGVGAAGLGTYSYMKNKPRDNLSGKSINELDQGANLGRLAAEGPEKGFLQKVRNRNAEATMGHAQALREHPGIAAGLGAAVGAGTGVLTSALWNAGKKAVKGAK